MKKAWDEIEADSIWLLQAATVHYFKTIVRIF